VFDELAADIFIDDCAWMHRIHRELNTNIAISSGQHFSHLVIDNKIEGILRQAASEFH